MYSVGVKQPTPFFLSYTRADQTDIERFFEVLNSLLKIFPKYDFHLWQDTAILPGKKWREEIDTALKTSRFGRSHSQVATPSARARI